MLTKEEIRLILEYLSEVSVVEPSPAFPYRVSQTKRGYSSDPAISKLQAKLSMMLEVAR